MYYIETQVAKNNLFLIQKKNFEMNIINIYYKIHLKV